MHGAISLQILINGLGGKFGLSHGEDDCRAAGDDISSRKHAFFGGLHRNSLSRNSAVLHRFKLRCGVGNQWTWALPDGNHHHIGLDEEVGTFNRYWLAATGCIGFAKFILDTLQCGDAAILAVEGDGSGQQIELHAFLFSMVDFLHARRHFST
jgi:hypothetical protein